MNSTASLLPPPLPTTSFTHSTSSTSKTSSKTTSRPPVSKTTKTKVVTPSGVRSTVTSVHTISAPKTSSSHHTTHTGAAVLPAQDSSSGGLSGGAKIAIGVVIPVVVVILLCILGIFLWRRRKQRKEDAEARRKEVEEYGYNPNNDPTLPAVAGIAGSDSPEMSEDTSGYRGWGNNTTANGTMSARKPSTNLSSGVGMAFSDDGRGRSPGSLGQGDGEPMMEGAAAATGAATGVAAAGMANRTSRGGNGGNGVQRGTSNASSTYSAAGRTDDSGDVMAGAQQDFNYDNNYTSYNPAQGNYGEGGAPVIRDVNARRNTKIENAVYPQQGNSGIAQNF